MDGSSRDSTDRRIFLVANGPSLAKTPLDKLIGEESWGLARIHLIYDKTDWRPTRYWWSDHPQDQENMDDVLWHIEQDYPCWIRRDVCEIITGDYVPSGPDDTGRYVHPATWAPEPQPLPENVTPWDYCKVHNAGFIRDVDGTADIRRPDGWHLDDGLAQLCKYGSGFNCMMQQAVREGYNPIYLVGADLGYVGRDGLGEVDPDHFHPKYNTRWADKTRAQMDNDTQVDMHTHAQNWCKPRGIQILNATLGVELQVYEQVDFFSLF